MAVARNARLRAALRALTAETAYWNPAIVTDKDGKATVTFTLPEQSTAWRLLAKGITADTLAGEAAETLVVKKELFGELKLPPSFTDGDQAEVIASIHNDAVEKGPIEVTLRDDHRRPHGRGEEDRRRSTPRAFGKWRSRGLQRERRPRRAARGGRSISSLTVSAAAGQRQDVCAAVGAASALRRAGLRHGRRFGRRGHDRLGRAAARSMTRRNEPTLCRSSSARRSSEVCWTCCSARRRRARSKSAGSPRTWRRPPAT